MWIHNFEDCCSVSLFLGRFLYFLQFWPLCGSIFLLLPGTFDNRRKRFYLYVRAYSQQPVTRQGTSSCWLICLLLNLRNKVVVVVTTWTRCLRCEWKCINSVGIVVDYTMTRCWHAVIHYTTIATQTQSLNLLPPLTSLAKKCRYLGLGAAAKNVLPFYPLQ